MSLVHSRKGFRRLFSLGARCSTTDAPFNVLGRIVALPNGSTQQFVQQFVISEAGVSREEKPPANSVARAASHASLTAASLRFALTGAFAALPVLNSR